MIETMPMENSADASVAQQQLTRQKSELRQLEDARHKREAKEDKARLKLAQAQAIKQKKCASLAQQQKWREEDVALAPWKSREKAKLKARRMHEKYQLECST